MITKIQIISRKKKLENDFFCYFCRTGDGWGVEKITENTERDVKNIVLTVKHDVGVPIFLLGNFSAAGIGKRIRIERQ